MKRMLAVADKLIEMGCDELGGIVFRNIIEGSEERGAISAMNQGQSISVLIRAWQLTKDDKYLRTSNKAIAPFYYTKQEGGVVGRIPNGNILWYEEYPHDPFHVLNGKIYSLWGLYDLAVATSNTDAKKLFDAGVESVIQAMPQFDTGYWSFYWVPDKPEDRYVASLAYHSCHIIQLRALGDQTGRKELYQWADKFWKYSLSPINRGRAAIAIGLSKLHQITHGIK
jgi:heparosan-N-sulfate-glucuronate 5-epimerase